MNTLLFLFFTLLTGADVPNPDVSVIRDENLGAVAVHGFDKLVETLENKKITYEIIPPGNNPAGNCVLIAGTLQGGGLASRLQVSGDYHLPHTAEALTVRRLEWKKKPAVLVCGADDTGLMYALLDIAKRISWCENTSKPLQFVKEITTAPYLKERGLSMYTMNRAYWESRFYDENFWKKYFEMMAQNRFNMLEILFGYENGGFMAPCYPYFFPVEGYPGVKMADITPEQQKRNVETMNRLIETAHGYGIRIRLGVWDHIYRGGVQAGGNPDFEYVENRPLPWQVSGLDSTNLNNYTKAAFAKFLKTFPELDAILFKTNNESGLKESELHAFSLNFFETVKEYAPDMHVDIHAKGITDTLIRSAINLGIKFRLAPKFWMEQMGLPYSPTHINREDQRNRRHGYANLLRYPQHYRMLWKLWNGGTNRAFLWGDPEYVKRFAESSRLYDSDAYEVYEPLATKMESQEHDAPAFQLLNPQYRYFDYEFERYWFFFQTFGLLGYDPDASTEIWDKEFEVRFGKEAGVIVKQALEKASRVLPRIIAACYPYSFFPTTSAWPEKQRLGDLPLYAKAEGSDLQQFASFDEEAQTLLGTGETAKILPSVTALWLEQLSEDINKKADEAEKTVQSKNNKEFITTITDLRMLSNLSLYHSRRIPAAVSYCLFLRTQDVSALDAAISHEQKAIEAWQQLVDAAGDVYAENILIGKKPLSGHWKDELALLLKGLEKLREQRANFEPERRKIIAPVFRKAEAPDNSRYFTINHTPPEIADPRHPLLIRVEVSAPAGLKWVRLQYRAVNQYKDFEMLPMTPVPGQRNAFQVAIPNDRIDPHYDLMYLIEMMDNKGKGFIYPDVNKETPYKIIGLKRTGNLQ
jgi:hypothetical protein